MCGNCAYSEKEIDIFNGIAQLINQGEKLENMKIADIAAAAGIGKSTAYEYFSSKEEILRKALRYHVEREIEAIEKFVHEQNSFREILDRAMEYTEEMVLTRFFSLLMMIINLDQNDLLKLARNDHQMFIEVQHKIDSLIAIVLAKGRQEELIGLEVEAEDCKLVLAGLLSSYSHQLQVIQCFHKGDKNMSDKLKKRSKSLILKALR